MPSLRLPAYAAILGSLSIGCGVVEFGHDTSGSSAVEDASNGGDAGASPTDDDEDGGAAPGRSPRLPSAKGPCPAFADGMLTFGTRSARVWLDASAAAAKDGPLVFYWYGTGGEPSQAARAIDIAQITSAGGIVVAPLHENDGAFPWIISGGTADYELADEVVACAEQVIGIDDRHIHSHGFSAGGLFSAQFGFARANYLASVAMYSGGTSGNSVDPDNHFPALVIYGGPDDQYMSLLNFADSSLAYADALKTSGQYVVMCDHGGKHALPTTSEAAALSSAFFLAHPYRASSPWGPKLPAHAPAYCSAY